ncbi:MAG: glycosylhydrolase-like jelly roll fold domain-containing protein, partial [Verrucomicrobiota bacterium]
HPPFNDRYKPGKGMGSWGTHFGRNQTWFEPGKEFFRYLGRVQAVLQRGETPSDFVSVSTQQGDGDVIAQRMLKEVRVEGGQIVLPSGRKYAFISFPHNGSLQPEIVQQIKKLLTEGAIVVCAKPNKSPSLASYPQCDDEVRRLAEKLWGDDKSPIRQVGSGKLFTLGDVGAALAELNIAPIGQILTPKLDGIRIAARQDGETKIFFVANVNQKSAKFTASFRVAGMQPELWDAENDTMQLAPLWFEKNGRTEVDLSLGAAKSVFVVFRSRAISADRLASIESSGDWKLSSDAQGCPLISANANFSGTAVFASGRRMPFELKPAAAVSVVGPWQVDLVPAVGASGKIELPVLMSLSESEDAAVKYFSGTATYSTTVKVAPSLLAEGKRVELDLGDVCSLVTIKVNGQNIGVVWHPPFVRDITSALKPGENSLELAVANTWHNRLVGDEQFSPDFEFGTDRGADRGRALKAYPDWFLKNQLRPQTNRLAFVNWYYHRKNTPLIPAGLLGPVHLVPQAEVILKP